MAHGDAVFANARVKACEERLLSSQELERLSEMTPAYAARTLSERGFGAGSEQTELSAMCDAQERALWEFVDDVSPDKGLTDLFKLENDAVNLKLLLKAKLLGDDAEGLAFAQGVFPVAALESAISEECEDETLPEPLLSAVRQACELANAERPDVQRVCAAADAGVYGLIFLTLKKKNAKGLTEYFKRKADGVNLLSLLRARALGMEQRQLSAMLIDGGNIESERFLSALSLTAEELCESMADCFASDDIRAAAESYAGPGGITAAKSILDSSLFEVMYSKRNEIFGIEPLITYLLTKQNELQAVRRIAAKSGKDGEK